LHKEAGDVNLIEAEKKMDEIRTTLKEKGYSRENTFNMDESGLFYRCMPNRTCVVDGGDVQKLGNRTKAMKAKDRVTAIFCCNSTGTCKIPTLIIGTSKQPHCFRNGRYPLPYIDQKKHGWTRNDIKTGGLMCFFRASSSLRKKKWHC
jgi:hypothetical protein